MLQKSKFQRCGIQSFSVSIVTSCNNYSFKSCARVEVALLSWCSMHVLRLQVQVQTARCSTLFFLVSTKEVSTSLVSMHAFPTFNYHPMRARACCVLTIGQSWLKVMLRGGDGLLSIIPLAAAPDGFSRKSTRLIVSQAIVFGGSATPSRTRGSQLDPGSWPELKSISNK